VTGKPSARARLVSEAARGSSSPARVRTSTRTTRAPEGGTTTGRAAAWEGWDACGWCDPAMPRCYCARPQHPPAGRTFLHEWRSGGAVRGNKRWIAPLSAPTVPPAVVSFLPFANGRAHPPGRIREQGPCGGHAAGGGGTAHGRRACAGSGANLVRGLHRGMQPGGRDLPGHPQQSAAYDAAVGRAVLPHRAVGAEQGGR
jgi:hypothetical protein